MTITGLCAVAMAMAGVSVPTAAMAEDPKPVAGSADDTDDAAIAAEMAAQAKLRPAADILNVAALDDQPGFASVAFEGNGLTLYYKGELTLKMAAALAEARSYGSVRVSAAAHSYAELRAAADSLRATFSKTRSDVQRVTLAPNGSGLTVESLPPSEAKVRNSARAAKNEKPLIAARSAVPAEVGGVPIRFTPGTSTLQLLAATRYNDSPAWNGGSRWRNQRNGTMQPGYCSTGFGVKNASGSRYVLTAAHCARPGDNAYQGHEDANSLELMGPVYLESKSADLLIIKAPGSSLIFEGTTTTSTTRTVRGYSFWNAGELVCQSGVTTAMTTSKEICGLRSVQAFDWYNAGPDDEGAYYDVIGLVETMRPSGYAAAYGGDSGGPVYTKDGTVAVAEGTVTAGDGYRMYYQDWADVLRVWNLTPY